MKLIRHICIILLALVAISAEARHVRVYGYVVDGDNVGIELANVYLKGTTTGTTTNRNGYYDLQFTIGEGAKQTGNAKGAQGGSEQGKQGESEQGKQSGDAQEADNVVTIVWSMLGYVTTEQKIRIDRDVVNINVMLPTDAEMLDQVEVRGINKQTDSYEQTDIKAARVMPDATGGGIESLMITFAGVRQNNELSSQYNVRGGSFDENSVYVNGIEVYRPLLLRAGQQEGLSFVNPEMTEKVEFSAGGFDAKSGDKMSSVLDITYKQPTRFEGTASVSLLGANAYIGFGNERHSEMHSIRYKTSKYMLGALPTAGSYQPNFVDYQTQLTWNVGGKPKFKNPRKMEAEDFIPMTWEDMLEREEKLAHREPWTISLMGNFSQNTYQFIPDSMSAAIGGLAAAKQLKVEFDGLEKDVFRTAFAALSAEGYLGQGVTIGFTASGFYTNEQERYDIAGHYRLTDGPAGMTATGSETGEEGEEAEGNGGSGGNGNSGGSEGGGGAYDKDNDMPQGEVEGLSLGTGNYHEHARNRLQMGIVNVQHHGEWKYDRNTLSWGVGAKLEMIDDVISEWRWRDSAGYSLPNSAEGIELDYAMKGTSSLQSARVHGYVQDAYKWSTDAGNVYLTGGVRMSWWSFTNEFLCSPRASVVYMPGWKRDLTLRLSTGLYYQSPFYKELKDTLTGMDGITRFTLNKNLKSQRSAQVVLGADYYFRAWGRPFKFTAEAYYKYIDRMISYTVENVRVRYSGENDAVGYSTGLDLKLFGELVPGADSWISFGLMRSRMRLIDQPEAGWLMGPNEQRFALSMLFQDYFPRFPQLKFHIKFVYSDGLPYCFPNKITSQSRMPSYKRFDIGATYVFKHGQAKFMKSEHVPAWWLQFEIFNLIGFNNVNSYFWAQDYNNNFHPFPNYLTGRMYNFKMTIDLK